MKKVYIILFLVPFCLYAIGTCSELRDNVQLDCGTHNQFLDEHNAPCCVNSTESLFEVVDVTYNLGVYKEAAEVPPSIEPYIYTKISSDPTAEVVIVGKTSTHQIDQRLLTYAIVDEVTLVDANDNNKTIAVYKNLDLNLSSDGFNSLNLKLNLNTLDIPLSKKAFKNIKVEVKGHYGDYRIIGQPDESDNFAIRPNKFRVVNNDTSKILYAKKDGINHLEFQALDINGAIIQFNTKDIGKFHLIASDKLSLGGICKTGSFWNMDSLKLNDKISNTISTIPMDFNDTSHKGIRDTSIHKMTYFGVGDVKLSMSENNITVNLNSLDKRDSAILWAAVDRDDNDNNIPEDIMVVKNSEADNVGFVDMNRIYPDHINIQNEKIYTSNGQYTTTPETSADTDWVYMANNIEEQNLTISYDLNMTGYKPDVDAQVSLFNFITECYSQTTIIDLNGTIDDINTNSAGQYFDVNLSNPEHDTMSKLIASHESPTSFSAIENGNMDGTNNEINLISLRESFVNDVVTAGKKNGTAAYSLVFNVKRNFSDPKEPFMLKDLILDSNRSGNIANVKHKLSLNKDITFYYARMYPEDLITSDITGTANIYAEIYQKRGNIDIPGSTLKSFRTNWFVNEEEDGSLAINISSSSGVQKSTKLPSSPSLGLTSSYDNNYFTNGKIINTITRVSSKVVRGTVHYKIPRYMWLSRHGRNYSDLDTGLGSSCLDHPCSRYEYIANLSDGVEAGNVKDGTTKVKVHSDRQRKFGGKTFR